MKVLVTGGAGFIGSNLVKRLSSEPDIKVRVIDDLSTGIMSNLESCINKIEFVEGNILDERNVDKICRDVDVIFHLAAKISVEDSINNPIPTNLVNINGTLNLLNSAKEHKIKRFIFSSSAAVYGCTDLVPVEEISNANPESPYALQKYTGEKYCKYFSEFHGLNTICLRYFNAYGPNQQENGGYAGVIYKFIKSVLEEKAVSIEGDGTQTRDFVFVDDIVQANMLSLRSNLMSNSVYNVGTAHETSVNALFNTIKNIVGNNTKASNTDKRPGDIKRSCANISLITKELGYKPTHSLEEGLKKTVNWLK